jgi:hypothetical protein
VDGGLKSLESIGSSVTMVRVFFGFFLRPVMFVAPRLANSTPCHFSVDDFYFFFPFPFLILEQTT